MNELEVLAAVWQDEGPAENPADFCRRVRRQSFWMRVNALLEWLMAMAFLAGSLAQAIARPTPEYIVLAVGIWIITIGACLYSVANRAGTWSAAGEDPRAYLALSLRRCRARLAALRFALWFLAVEVALLGAWHAWFWSKRTPPSLTVWLIVSLLPLGMLLVILYFRVRRGRELAQLESLEREFAREN
jgi:hypothetical protein